MIAFDRKCLVKVGLILSSFFIWQIYAYSEEIHLKNGDTVSGEIIEQSDENISLKTEAMGTIIIKKDFVEYIGSAKKETLAQVEEKLWQREVSLGYNASSGNTQNNQFSLKFSANRKIDQVSEFTLKGDIYYSSSNGRMDAQKWQGTARYAFSFWESKWYNFYKIESDHDRFADINYRIVPSAGVGYWFSDQPDWKAMVELGMGLEYTNFKSDTKDNSAAILIPRAFFEKKLFADSRISQDIILYNSLEAIGEYRLHSETSLVNPINDKLSLRLSLIADYNSAPPEDTKKRDVRFISALTYTF
ncbi:MAG: DUF481 domain-containing protein [Omnitrophica bacterium]|nr:DUF481 domain-containing protein [Candidatus Omnitrophota bacterium]